MSDQLNDTPENLIPVNILIADRNYRVKISTKDEESVRKTAALINQKLVEFKGLYGLPQNSSKMAKSSMK